MPVPVALGSRCRGPRIGVVLGGLLALTACADPPTNTTAGSPTISPLVVAECQVGVASPSARGRR